MHKVSIRFFNDREIRAVWDDAAAKWWFSVLDVAGALNGEPDYAKTRNYWKYLKAKLKREKSTFRKTKRCTGEALLTKELSMYRKVY